MVSLLLLAAVAGCKEESAVTRYEVPKPAVVFKDNHSPEHAPQEPESGGATRLIAAMMFRPDATYFVKVSDDAEAVEAVSADVHDFIRAITFPEVGPPQWELLEDWTETPGTTAVRVATVRTPSDIVVAVTQFPAGQDRLDNLNRWRKEVTLPEFGSSDEFTEENGVETIDQPWGELIVVDFLGTKNGGGMAAPVAGGGSRGPSPHGPSPHGGAANFPKSSTPTETLAYEAPEEWKADPASGERVAAFTVEHDGDEGTIVAFQMGGGDRKVLIGTLNIWLASMEQTPFEPDDDLGDVTETVRAKGMEGELLDIAKPGDDPAREALVGAVFPTETYTWVVKFTGPKRLIDHERERFDAFLESLEARPKGGNDDGE